jgi:hypothetical protein
VSPKENKVRWSRVALRASAGVVLLLALGGPTPGYVGNCSGGGTPAGVDPVAFCTNKRTYICARDNYAGRIDMNQYNQCRAMIDSVCAGFSFGSCAPTQSQAQACIDALADPMRVGTPDSMIPECSSTALCGGTMLVAPDPGGI